MNDVINQSPVVLQGPYQMLFSKKSPLTAKGLNIFYRILYLSPCYIYIVSALGTPTFMAIPIIYIWAGRFPAVLTSTVISWMIAYTVLSYMIKCYVRPGRNIIHDFRCVPPHRPTLFHFGLLG